MYNHWGPTGITGIYGEKLCFTIIYCIVVTQVYWYRQGELDPKFRKLLIYNAFVLIVLCICANLYFLQVGYHGVPKE